MSTIHVMLNLLYAKLIPTLKMYVFCFNGLINTNKLCENMIFKKKKKTQVNYML